MLIHYRWIRLVLGITCQFLMATASIAQSFNWEAGYRFPGTFFPSFAIASAGKDSASPKETAQYFGYALLNLSAFEDPSSDNEAIGFRDSLAKELSNSELEAAQDLTHELAEPNNFLIAMDRYLKKIAIKEKTKK